MEDLALLQLLGPSSALALARTMVRSSIDYTFNMTLLEEVRATAVASLVAQKRCVVKTDDAEATCSNLTDCTDDLQRAIIAAHHPVGSGRLLVSPLPDKAPWIVRPIFLNVSDVHITFAPGVEVLAMRDQFRGETSTILAYVCETVFSALNTSSALLVGPNREARLPVLGVAGAQHLPGRIWRNVEDAQGRLPEQDSVDQQLFQGRMASRAAAPRHAGYHSGRSHHHADWWRRHRHGWSYQRHAQHAYPRL
jgi:hypothetical protein